MAILTNNSGIYKFINKFNNKVYIGKASNLKVRIEAHINKCKNKKYKSYLYSSIQKHGLENFELEILVEGNFNEDELNQMEVTYIRLFKSNNPSYGYNLTAGGEGTSGFYFNHTEEAKQKIRKTSLGRKHSEETKNKLSKINKGRVVSDETRKKQSKSAKNKKPISEETRKKLSEVHKGNTYIKGRKQSPEHIEKRMKSKIGKKLKPESIKKREQTRKFNRNMQLIKENNFTYDWLYV